MTKQGDGTVRKLLYEPANSILTRSRETFALNMGREDRQASRLEESLCRTRPSARGHHASHAA